MLEYINCKCEIIKNFSPAWFASVMGTGILAITSLFYSQYFGILYLLAKILFILNIAMFAILLIPWLLRWIIFTDKALSDLNHPIVSNFYPTMSVGMLVLASDFLLIGKEKLTAEIFWLCGTLLTVIFSFLIPYITFKENHVKIDHINPAWFIPPVALIVIPIAGSQFIGKSQSFLEQLFVFINYYGWGSGFFIYLALLSICMYRFILHNPLPNTLAPTIWINLGPIGAGTVSLINLINKSIFISMREPFWVFGLIFWGFGVWWFFIAVIMTLHYVRKLKLPYAMSWWAFTFPLGAYVASSHLVSTIFKIRIIDYFGFMLYFLLLGIWSITFIRTLCNAYKGILFADG